MPKVKIKPVKVVSTYAQQSQQPLQALLFLLPMIVLYEMGVLAVAAGHQIKAEAMLRMGFGLLGVTGYYLPGLLVVAVLISWHVVRKDPWQVRPRLYGLMLLESFALALPLLLFMLLVFQTRATSLASADGSGPAWMTDLVLSLGAGIYEEMLFRLVGIALLHMILVDAIRLPHEFGAVVAISLTSLGFAFYHFSSSNPFSWARLIFYSGAGLYLAGVYLKRGFGIAAGTHAVYDVLIVGLQMVSGH